jgi:hypothetical protein
LERGWVEIRKSCGQVSGVCRAKVLPILTCRNSCEITP